MRADRMHKLLEEKDRSREGQQRENTVMVPALVRARLLCDSRTQSGIRGGVEGSQRLRH